MDSRVFDIDPVTGQQKVFHYDHNNDRFHIETKMDVEPILDLNKAQLIGESSKGRNWRGDMHKVASIPMHVYLDLQKRGIIQDQRKFKAWLNDPDNKYYRTKGGRV
jgi:hypothetical protein